MSVVDGPITSCSVTFNADSGAVSSGPAVERSEEQRQCANRHDQLITKQASNYALEVSTSKAHSGRAAQHTYDRV